MLVEAIFRDQRHQLRCEAAFAGLDPEVLDRESASHREISMIVPLDARRLPARLLVFELNERHAAGYQESFGDAEQPEHLLRGRHHLEDIEADEGVEGAVSTLDCFLGLRDVDQKRLDRGVAHRGDLAAAFGQVLLGQVGADEARG